MIEKSLRPWLWTLAWLAMFTGLMFYFYAAQSNFIYNDFARALQHTQSTIGDGTQRTTLVIGDSLLVYSLPQESVLQEKLNAGVVKLYWMPITTWHAYEQLTSFSDKDLKHSTILLHDSLFLNRKKSEIQNQLHFAKIALRNISHENTIHESLMYIYRHERPVKCRARKYSDYNVSDYSINTRILDEDAKHFLAQLKIKSRQLVVIAFPRADIEQERRQKKWRNQLMHELAELGIQVKIIGSEMPRDYYCDGSHPNEQGRQLRAAQFIKYAQELESLTP